MAHFAELNEEGRVLRVVVVDDDATEESCALLFGGGRWKQTSYTASVRGKFAGIGDRYDTATDTFIAPEQVDEEV